jgi:hypothetical protein
VISTNTQTDLNLKEGDTDSYGAKVVAVYDRDDSKYIIYEDSQGNLKCGDHGIKLSASAEINSAIMKIAELFTISPSLGKKYNSHRALGIRHWCRGEVAEASQALEDTFQMMDRTFSRRARLLYISGSTVVCGVMLIASILSALQGRTTMTTWSLVFLFGALGAFVSVAIKLRSPSLDVLDDKSATFFYGIVRSIVAIVFASLMYLLVLGGVLLPGLVSEGAPRLLVLAFVAGFSEKLVPEAVIHQAIGAGHAA